MTQTERLRDYLVARPGASILEITFGLHPFVANPRARISDLRDELEGSEFQLVKAKRPDGRWGYALAPREPLTLFGKTA